MRSQRQILSRWIFFAGVSLLYAAVFALLAAKGLYRIENAHNDRLFSADDIYYVKNFFSAEMDASLRIIKHPLLVVFGWLLTLLERAVLGEVGVQTHYLLIVAVQCAATLGTVYVLDRIFETQYRMKTGSALLLCGIYAASFSVLFFCFVGESYALSALLITLSFYQARRGNTPAVVLLGALAAGTTVTNGVLWAAIVLLSGGSWKRRLLTLAGGTVLFFALVAAFPVRTVFFRNFISGSCSSVRNYSDHFGPFSALRYVFYAFFGSTSFVIDVQMQSPFGEFVGDALSFVPSAPWPITAAALAFLGLLVWAIAAHRHDRRLYAPLAVLALNLLLHGVLQYGLKEAFLYSLHHYPAQLLIVGLLLAGKTRENRVAFPLLCGYGLCILTLNLPGYLGLLRFLGR